MKTVYNLLLLSLIILQSCKEDANKLQAKYFNAETPEELPTPELSKEFNEYWYSGKAEITSYQLSQYRYGQERKGKAVLVFVTEPFLQKEQVKADDGSPSNIPVLKLNSTKNFNTGIYPYSIMQSTFYPVSNNDNAIKVSCSVQEWCGHTYTQLNNREQFEIKSHSYFEGEADQHFKLQKAILENELWTQLRVDPKSLQVGKFEIIPALEFIRLKHQPLKIYEAIGLLTENNYSLFYPELERTLSITFDPKFPYIIQNWEETIDGKTTKATRLKTIKSAYWNKNENKDEVLRKTLLLE